MAELFKKNKELLMGVLAMAASLAVLILIILATAPTPAPAAETTAPVIQTPEPNIYGPEDFEMDGDYLTCISGESMLGIDVSAHQREIDWEQVAASGVEFAMIRLGYRGYGTGAILADTYVYENLTGARAAGLKIGAYFYSQAISVEEAREEAVFALEILGGYPLDFPLAFDWEYVSEDARTGSADARMVTDCSIAFCEAVKKAGYQPMVYFNPYWGETYFELTELEAYPFWLAMYREEMNYPYRVDMWQYTSKGSVDGIRGNVDLNLYLP